jgi:hypothetical protein
MRTDIKNFPPPDEANAILGHDGSLAEDEVAHLQRLGYHVAHWKSFSGNRLVQAYFEGVAKGLIELDDTQFRTVESMRKLGGADLSAKPKEEVSDVMSVLSAPLRQSGVGKGPLKRRASPTKPVSDETEE